jgi:hypothetical protein
MSIPEGATVVVALFAPAKWRPERPLPLRAAGFAAIIVIAATPDFDAHFARLCFLAAARLMERSRWPYGADL